MVDTGPGREKIQGLLSLKAIACISVENQVVNQCNVSIK